MHWKREASPEEPINPFTQAALGPDDQAVCYPTRLTGAQQEKTRPISTVGRREQWIQNKARETLLRHSTI